MKKFLSLVLALVMVMSLSVTASAEGGTITLTAEVPNAAEPSYTLHIPANTMLTYGNTEKQQVSGMLYVENVQNASKVSFLAPYTDLINTSDSSDTIHMDLFAEMPDYALGDYVPVNPTTGEVNGDPLSMYNVGWGPGEEYERVAIHAQVADWSGATPGATYQAIITFQVWAE